MSKNVSFDNLGNELNKIINDYVKDKPTKIRNINKEYASKYRQELQDTANIGKSRLKKYSRGFVIEDTGTSFIVRNKNKPGLTHLLEFGTYRARGFYKYQKAWNKISPRHKAAIEKEFKK
jgi:hypothetical protein